jgi:ABC-type Na+ efflux pump permease subunit
LYATPAAQPAKSISLGSYNPALHTVFIHGDTTYGIAPEAKFFLGEKAVNEEVLQGTYAVDSVGSRLIDGSKMITQLNLSVIPHRMNAGQVRQLLLGLIVLEFAVILLIVTNAAASAVTREKEDGSLDLLLSTPITSRYYLWGKLRGLVSFVLPLVAVPVGSVLLFVLYDICRLIGGAGGVGEIFDWIVFPESLVLLPAMLVIVIAFASIVGMQMSLRCRTTVGAVMSSVAIVLGLCGVLIGCGSGSLGAHGGGDSIASLVVPSFSPFTMVSLLVDPYRYDITSYANGAADDIFDARLTVTISALIAIGTYALIVWAMYNSMVKNFDMTIRRQQR